MSLFSLLSKPALLFAIHVRLQLVFSDGAGVVGHVRRAGLEEICDGAEVAEVYLVIREGVRVKNTDYWGRMEQIKVIALVSGC